MVYSKAVTNRHESPLSYNRDLSPESGERITMAKVSVFRVL